MASTLKERKEQFVTGLTGGSTLEIYYVTSISVLSYIAYLFFQRRLSRSNNEADNKVIIQILDFGMNWILLLLSITSYASRTSELILFAFIPVVLILILEIVTSSGVKTAADNRKQQHHQGKKNKKTKIQLVFNAKNLIVHKSYLTVYRSQMMVITMIAILAVDFKIFPRRFAKVETWGTSLMDLGVGSFVFSLGLFSSKSLIMNKFGNSNFKFTNMMWKSIKHSIPLLVLGFLRLISVKMVGYQEHVTEYGYHWNFFFTLGALPIFVCLVSPLTLWIPQIVLSLMISAVYEMALMKTDLLKYILTAPRDDLVSANREGIFSFIGYLAIYLSGESCGFFLLPGLKSTNNLLRPGTRQDFIDQLKTGNKTRLRTSKNFTVTPWKGLLILSVFYHCTYYVIDTCYSYHVSRRLANFLYVVWVCGYNTTFLGLFYIASQLFNGEPDLEYTTADSDSDKKSQDLIKAKYLATTPKSLEAVNRNGLVLFLVSNLLTGMVNMTLNTLDATPREAMAALVTYCGVLAMIALTLYNLKIFIKF